MAGTVPVRLAELSVRYRPVTATASEVVYAGDGRHELSVSAVDENAFESAPSAPLEIAVGDAVAPPPVTLTATLDGADAVLSWTESAATDLGYYGVYRDGVEIASALDLADRTYRDGALANGTYLYSIRAFDQVGNASDPSNEVALTVTSPVPEPPTALAVSDPGTGDALDLSWSPPAGGPEVAGYAIERGASSGGPYSRSEKRPGTAYRDRGLSEGVPAFYVVRAVDARGNSSDPSNEASGVPEDRLGPPSILHHPATRRSPLPDHGAAPGAAGGDDRSGSAGDRLPGRSTDRRGDRGSHRRRSSGCRTTDTGSCACLRMGVSRCSMTSGPTCWSISTPARGPAYSVGSMTRPRSGSGTGNGCWSAGPTTPPAKRSWAPSGSRTASSGISSRSIGWTGPCRLRTAGSPPCSASTTASKACSSSISRPA